MLGIQLEEEELPQMTFKSTNTLSKSIGVLSSGTPYIQLNVSDTVENGSASEEITAQSDVYTQL